MQNYRMEVRCGVQIPRASLYSQTTVTFRGKSFAQIVQNSQIVSMLRRTNTKLLCREASPISVLTRSTRRTNPSYLILRAVHSRTQKVNSLKRIVTKLTADQSWYTQIRQRRLVRGSKQSGNGSSKRNADPKTYSVCHGGILAGLSGNKVKRSQVPTRYCLQPFHLEPCEGAKVGL